MVEHFLFIITPYASVQTFPSSKPRVLDSQIVRVSPILSLLMQKNSAWRFLIHITASGSAKTGKSFTQDGLHKNQR